MRSGVDWLRDEAKMSIIFKRLRTVSEALPCSRVTRGERLHLEAWRKGLQMPMDAHGVRSSLKTAKDKSGQWVAALIAVLYIAVGPTVSHADPEGGTVTGVVELPPPADRKERVVRNVGFTKPAPGPLKSPRKFDPRNQIVVILDGGPVSSSDSTPPKRKARYELIGESFNTDIFAYVAGGEVEIKNSGRNSPRLYAPSSADAIESSPVNPKGIRPVKAPTEAYKTLVIRDRESAHLSGILLAVPHSYFSLLDSSGNFKIEGVPAGRWTIKLWHRDGWLTTSGGSVTVAGKRAVKASSIRLPAELKKKATE